MASAAIGVDRVSKCFRLPGEKAHSVKERVLHPRRRSGSDFWALRDVSLEVAEGETVGLLGPNGSGKSTLLKLVGGILQPTSGSVRVRGRVASLLELGAGMHPDLTGRENVFINGAILGLSRRDIAARFDDIVEFAELEQFIDTPIKAYSSGMYVRLGFAVAVNVDPDILLVDEVLAVGDEAFQRKCIDRVSDLQRDGRTIVVVSHSADQLRKICDRVAVVDRGSLVTCGPPGESIRVFRERLLEHQLERQELVEARQREETLTVESSIGAPPALSLSHGAMQESLRNLKVRITSVTLSHPHEAHRPYLLPGEPLTVTVGYSSDSRIDDVIFGIAIHDGADGRHLFGINTALLGCGPDFVEGDGEISFQLEDVPLLDGTYPVSVGITSHDDGTVYDWSEQRHWFEVMNPDRRVGTVAIGVLVQHRTM
jgi:ABC-2 type transport system ATP-binding protein